MSGDTLPARGHSRGLRLRAGHEGAPSAGDEPVSVAPRGRRIRAGTGRRKGRARRFRGLQRSLSAGTPARSGDRTPVRERGNADLAGRAAVATTVKGYFKNVAEDWDGCVRATSPRRCGMRP